MHLYEVQGSNLLQAFALLFLPSCAPSHLFHSVYILEFNGQNYDYPQDQADFRLSQKGAYNRHLRYR